jgi:glutamyl-tRNA synthetase
LDDQVLVKSDGYPTYHLAVVVDDHRMGISHILRAEEWLPSTPKHLYLFKWLGWEPPRFAHLPLLLNEDRSKMSKRSGDTAAEDYRRKGYLPDALTNFLALLGWNAGDEQELFTLQELIGRFTIERVTKAGAVFDRKKLDWMNQTYIGRLEPEALFDALRPFIAQTPHAGADEALLRKVCVTVQPSLVTLADIATHLRFFFRPDDAPLAPAVAEGLAPPEARTVVASFRDRLAACDRLDEAIFRSLMQEVQQATRIKGKGLWGPVRWAITHEIKGPDLAQVAAVLGREKALARLERVLGG